ncbi:hypothetical protein PVAND_002666 [Polypedilum vanderplanki]|uniref:Uncharacterized protein n=1 Tax=Polypedilum vanderplanki TaxID=319348 RepID=A0A9J6BRN4_POLVA|nr:hypothetical protein PVAND_002666 [Polypedilum vanderplanki]
MIMNRIANNSRRERVIVLLLVLLFTLSTCLVQGYVDTICPPQELILPCRCSQKNSEIQIWCSHSDLPRVLNGIKSTSKALNRQIDELILENNFLPSLPGRAFSTLQIQRLMLRHNGLERLSSGWLNDVENNLVEIFIVERGLRNIPVDSLYGLRNLEAITIQSESLKRSPEFSGLLKLRYINIESESLIELSPIGFRDLLGLESISIIGNKGLTRLEQGLFVDLHKLKTINLQNNGITWIHLRTFSSGLLSLQNLDLSRNRISDAGMVGRAIKDLRNLEVLNLSYNFIEILSEASFVDLPSLKELRLDHNLLQELHHGAFHRVPSLKVVHLENNRLRHVHPESFLMSSGRGVEFVHLQNNDLDRISEVRSILDALPTLRYLDLSYNKLTEIPFGSLRGHATLEQLQLDNNDLRLIERDALMAMPSLRELRMRNNSLTDLLPMPFWNLPALKGLDMSFNNFRRLEPVFFVGLPSLRRFDMSENSLSYIDQNVFKNTPMLETVNISANELNQIDRNTFSSLTNLFELDVNNNNLVEMITGLPRAIERVSLRNNKIVNLATNPHTFDLPNLRMIDLSNNGLSHIHQVFTRSPQLRVIHLAKNKLTSIDETSFLGLNHLEQLNLQDNMISAMHEMSTAGMNSLLELNLQGNRLQVFHDKILDNTPNIEKLDLSRNNIQEVMPNAFRKTRSLQNLDLSGNSLKELPESLDNLSNLKDIDVSFNNIVHLEPDVIKSWRNLEEFRASNNKIQEITQGTLKNLPSLQYVDLSSNDIASIHRSAVRNLPELQEIVLADNRLVELRERAFEDLPNLQAVHLQQNNLRMISPNTFYNAPSILYLNLSTNQFRHMENVNLRSLRNLEVLDLSSNEIRRVASNPLRGLDWLVELKLNDNRICKIQGEPFSAMPRLRVLNLRNNRMGRLQETNFRNLRSNIAILDVEGNPIDCSCDTLWLRAWLQETNSLAGPSCRDGTKLRDLDLNRQNCNTPDVNQISLTNEHGDVFLRHNDADDCGPVSGEGYEDFPPNSQYYNNNRPSPVESDYFYDQYVDFPINDTYTNTLNNSNLRLNQTSSPIVDFNQNKFTLNQFPPVPPQPTSAFTFFGHPLPSLNIGNLWGSGRTANTRATSGETSSNTRGKGRVQIFRPGDPELQVIMNRPKNELEISEKNREPAASVKNPIVNSPEMDKVEEKFYRPYFQTPFSQPKLEYSKEKHDKGFTYPTPEKGFSPMIPGVSVGGFIPIEDPIKSDSTKVSTKNNAQLETTTKFKNINEDDDKLKQVPLMTKAESATKRTIFKSPDNYVAQIEKVGTSTISSHLQTSISPILSTLIPKPELITEKSNFDDGISNNESAESEEISSSSHESDSQSSHKLDKITYDEDVLHQHNIHTSTYPSTTTNRMTQQTTLTLTSAESVTEFNENNTDDDIEQFNHNGSSELSADHLIAPGSIISQEVLNKDSTNKPLMTIPKPGKITKVFTPAPPTNSKEISKLLSPFYTTSEAPLTPVTNYDNEFQPNHVYQQTLHEENDKETADQVTAQYEREDMQWYFQNYHNQTNSNPILNYNLQPYDNYNAYNSSPNNKNLSFSSLILLIVITCYFH